MTLAIAGIVAGFIHVLSGPDHLAAIAPYAVDGKSRAWRTGVRWGLGHTTGVLGLGLLLLLLRDALPLDAVCGISRSSVPASRDAPARKCVGVTQRNDDISGPEVRKL